MLGDKTVSHPTISMNKVDVMKKQNLTLLMNRAKICLYLHVLLHVVRARVILFYVMVYSIMMIMC